MTSLDRKYLKYIIGAILFFCNFPVATGICATQEVSAKTILSRMQESRARLRNLQCLVEYDDFQTYSAKLRQLRMARKHQSSDKVMEMLNRVESDLAKLKPGTTEHGFQTQQLIMDSGGRFKVDLKAGTYDNSGKKGFPNFSSFKSVRLWNGETSIQYRKGNVLPRGSATITRTRPMTFDIFRNPLLSFGGTFMTSLSKAIEQRKDIDVEKNDESGTFKITFNNEQERKNIGIVDFAKGYSLCKHELYTGEALSVRWTANFEEFGEGIWFPAEGTINSYFDKPPYEPQTLSTVKVSNIKINDPNELDINLFHFDLPKGTRVIDAISGIQYIVGEPMSQKLHGVSGVQSIDEIAKDTLEEIAKEVEQKHEEIEIFIPKVSIALKKRTLFILDFSDRKLISAPDKPDSEKTHKYLTKIGEGDIAWDGTVVAIRGANILTTKQESNRPLTLARGKWSGAYKLPEKVELPYSMLIVTKEETNYLMTVRKIESGGIRVTYRQLYLEELSRYKQESKDK
ncbi:MAG: hypothetical protein FVQ84_04350 [Planctomycetes bacterium]|nr:hypothetical protein [Planctomycetota bacterium]